MEIKEEVIAWVDVDQVAKIERINGFIPVHEYYRIEATTPYEWGKVEQDDLIIRFRATSFVREIKRIFVG